MDKNIEPLSERKDMYIRTEDVASPNLKENSLQVESNISGLVTVAADASERKGLGTGLFGSAKVITSYLFDQYSFIIHAVVTKTFLLFIRFLRLF